jgi:hypothetical protein
MVVDVHIIGVVSATGAPVRPTVTAIRPGVTLVVCKTSVYSAMIHLMQNGADDGGIRIPPTMPAADTADDVLRHPVCTVQLAAPTIVPTDTVALMCSVVGGKGGWIRDVVVTDDAFPFIQFTAVAPCARRCAAWTRWRDHCVQMQPIPRQADTTVWGAMLRVAMATDTCAFDGCDAVAAPKSIACAGHCWLAA